VPGALVENFAGWTVTGTRITPVSGVGTAEAEAANASAVVAVRSMMGRGGESSWGLGKKASVARSQAAASAARI
jgi:uncharacterized membrane protein